MQLLEGIGTIKPDSRHREAAYQDSVTAPIDREHDNNAAPLDKIEEDDEQFNTLQGVLSAVDKVRHSKLMNTLLINDSFHSIASKGCSLGLVKPT